MFQAILTSFLFAATAICVTRSARLLGGLPGNAARLILAAGLLGLWTVFFGRHFGVHGEVFFLSGVVGFGIGGLAMFQAMPRLGSTLAMLLVQCSFGLFGAIIEWLWLGQALSPRQILLGAAILAGVAIALTPKALAEAPRDRLASGVAWALLAAFGQGLGAAISRFGFQQFRAGGLLAEPGTVTFQRLLGGLALGILALGAAWLYQAGRHRLRAGLSQLCANGRAAAPWVALNALFGPTLGVACYQWALREASVGLVAPIVATSPLLVAPLAWAFEGTRPRARWYLGAVFAVAGTVLLLRSK